MDAKKLVQELTDIENEIKVQENKRSRLEGEKELILKRLKEEFDLGSVREAKKKLAEMQDELRVAEEEIEKQMEELRAILPK
jgi:chromosome segregation ATPase